MRELDIDRSYSNVNWMNSLGASTDISKPDIAYSVTYANHISFEEMVQKVIQDLKESLVAHQAAEGK